MLARGHGSHSPKTSLGLLNDRIAEGILPTFTEHGETEPGILWTQVTCNATELQIHATGKIQTDTLGQNPLVLQAEWSLHHLPFHKTDPWFHCSLYFCKQVPDTSLHKLWKSLMACAEWRCNRVLLLLSSPLHYINSVFIFIIIIVASASTILLLQLYFCCQVRNTEKTRIQVL